MDLDLSGRRAKLETLYQFRQKVFRLKKVKRFLNGNCYKNHIEIKLEKIISILGRNPRSRLNVRKFKFFSFEFDFHNNFHSKISGWILFLMIIE